MKSKTSVEGLVSWIHFLCALSHMDTLFAFFLTHCGDNSLKRGAEPRLVQAQVDCMTDFMEVLGSYSQISICCARESQDISWHKFTWHGGKELA